MDDVPQTEASLPPIDVAIVDTVGLMSMLPHRYPLLLVDRLEDLRLGHSAVGIKNVSVNENFFQGHFPGHPVMPGVLIVESMAQTAAALVIHTLVPGKKAPPVYFMAIDTAKFRRPVVPGDQLRLFVKKDRNRGNVWRFNCVATVAGTTVAEATLTAMILDTVPDAQ